MATIKHWTTVNFMLYMHNGILLSHKKEKIMPFAATWMEPEIIILSEVSQTEKDKNLDIAYSGV